jgi:hypothetical protein
MYWTRWCRWFATSQLLRASHSFGVREQLKQQGAKSVNGPSFVCSLYSLTACASVGGPRIARECCACFTNVNMQSMEERRKKGRTIIGHLATLIP